MNRRLWLAMIVLAALAHSPALAAEGLPTDPGGGVVALPGGSTAPAGAETSVEARRPPPAVIEHYAGTDELAIGDWLLSFRNFGWFAPNGTVTGLAFGPGRAELAYCTSDGTAGPALWLASLRDLPQENPWEMNPVTATQRLLWRAPAGRTLSAPLWWAPNGSSLALLSRGGDTADLLSIDYVSGSATILARDVNVVDLAWEQNSHRLAYATESDGKHEVWLQTIPPGLPRRIGEGGFNLRWSLVDGTLTWLRPDSETTWSRQLCDPQSEQVKTIGSYPARTPTALWSPDGLLCADLEPTGGSGEKQVAIYPTGSRSGDFIALPEAHPERLLGWSPDSKLLLLLAKDGWFLAISSQPPGSSITQVLSGSGGDLQVRAILAGFGLDPRSAALAWNSASDLFVYAPSRRFVEQDFPGLTDQAPYGFLIVHSLTRKYYPPPKIEDLEREAVDSNMKNIALALQMYLADNNDMFPSAGDSESAFAAIDDYVRNRSIFLRPGTENEVIVQYVVPPGLWLARVQDPTRMPVAVVDYASSFYTVAYSDGHVETYDRTGDMQAKIDHWWAELDALRADDPNAMPPPFPPED